MPFGWDGGMKTRTSLFRWPETSPVPRTLKVPAPQQPKSLISLIGSQFFVRDRGWWVVEEYGRRVYRDVRHAPGIRSTRSHERSIVTVGRRCIVAPSSPWRTRRPPRTLPCHRLRIAPLLASSRRNIGQHAMNSMQQGCIVES